MYKMMIAEQDEEQAKKIIEFTSKSFKDIEVVNVEKSGSSVINYVKKNKIDILIVSIDLQGISGLEAVRRIRQLNCKIHIVILSENDYAELAMEGIHYGVKDYLVLPVVEKNYVDILKRIVVELNQIQKDRDAVLANRKKDNWIQAFAENSYIYSVLWNNRDTHTMKLYKETLGILPYAFICNIEMKNSEESGITSTEKKSHLAYNIIKNAISEIGDCIIGPVIGKRLIVMECCDKEIGSKEQQSNSIALANRIKNELRRECQLEVRIGIGRLKKLEEVRESYEESAKCLQYMDGREIVHINDLVLGNISQKSFIELETRFLQNAKFGKNEAMEQFSQIFDLLLASSLAEIRNKILELMVILCYEVYAQSDSEMNYVDYTKLIMEMNELDVNQLKDWAYCKIGDIIKSVRNNRNARKSVVVKEALEYINYNYGNDRLTLECISGYVGVTPQHFSKIFREETNFTFVEWLTNIRMEKAKEFLLEGTSTIKEICFSVGYRDPNYFSRKFKSIVGKSPTEFIEPDGESFSSSEQIKILNK